MISKIYNLYKYSISFVKTLKYRIFLKRMQLSLQSIIGRNFKVCGNGKFKIEKGFVARDNCRLESRGALFIGLGCFLNNCVSITALSNVYIGKNVSIGNNTVIIDHNHNYKKIGENLFITNDIKIGDNVWIGANVVILPGTEIGNNTIIGAGTVVRGIIPSNVIVYEKKELMYREVKINE